MFLLSVVFALLLVPSQAARLQLKDVHTVYVDSFGSDEGADVIRSKIISRLAQDGRVEVVLDRDRADATLTGGGTIRDRNSTAGIQLVDRESRIIWAGEVSSRASIRQGSSHNLAEDIVNDLLKAITKARKRH
jgi:hypothetical protein